MKRILICFFTINLFLSSVIEAHPWKADHYVVVDTDCGFDDFRAINLMMASPNIRILAIISSNGVIQSEVGYKKIRSLLKSNYHEGILVGLNNSCDQAYKNCEPAIQFNWGNSDIIEESKFYKFDEVLNQVFENCPEKITFINLGGLNTYAKYFAKNPQYKKQVKETLWTVNANNLKESFNYSIDSISYNRLRREKVDITLIDGASFGYYNDDLISSIKNQEHYIEKELYKSLSNGGTDYAKVMYDESVVFYELSKDIFLLDSIHGQNTFRLDSDIEITSAFLKLLNSFKKTQTQVFSNISEDTSDYIQDVRLIMDSTIKRFGEEEWSTCVLTSELHRHLGVYSIIGAKMGVRAKEYFGAGPDELQVLSFAGLTPPFSCLNDGLQVSTGATLGHGLISVNESMKLPKAEFEYLGQKISIILKESYRNKIASEIKELSIIYGLDSNIYWDLVRQLSLKYWSSWDRYEIFQIEVK